MTCQITALLRFGAVLTAFSFAGTSYAVDSEPKEKPVAQQEQPKPAEVNPSEVTDKPVTHESSETVMSNKKSSKPVKETKKSTNITPTQLPEDSAEASF